MMRWIILVSMQFRMLVVLGGVVLMVGGAWQLGKAPVDVFPEFAPPKVEIQTACVGLSAAEVEELITVPLEQSLAGVPGLDVLRSKSVGQLSSVTLLFEPGTDIMDARQLVQERVATVTPTLPSWATPPHMIQPLSSTSRVMKIGVSSDELDTIALSQLTRWKIRDNLMRVPGVANVAVWGNRKTQYQIQVDPPRLRRNGVTVDQVRNAAADAVDAGLLSYLPASARGAGGFVESEGARLGIEHVAAVGDPAELGAVTVRNKDGKDLRLDQVAAVKVGHQPLIGDAVVDGGPGLLLVVEKFPWANTLQVTRGVDDVLDRIEPGLTDVRIDATIFRPATFIETSIDNLTNALLLGTLLVILVLLAFLFEWRTALISVVAIPLSLVVAGLVLYLQGSTINTMVLAGFVISVGVVVDDAIIDIENIWRRLQLARATGDTTPTARIMLEASVEVRRAIVYATLINIVAITPVFFLEGLSGAFFRPLVTSYALALLASMAVALTVTPALGLLLLRRHGHIRRESPLKVLLVRWYSRVLMWLTGTARPAYLAVAGLGLLALVGTPQLGQALLPDFKERDLLMHWVTKPGTSLQEEVRITTRSAEGLGTIPGVRNFGAHIGQASNADEVVGPEFGENWISIDPEADYDDTLRAVQTEVDGYPGLYRDVQTYLKERIREVLTGTDEAIVVRISGDDLKTLGELADRLEDVMSDTPGLEAPQAELLTPVPQIEVKVDLAKAQQYGLKPGDVRREAATLVAGIEVADVYEAGRTYDVNVYGVASVRHSVASIRGMLIDTPDGRQVRLDSVADVVVEPTPNAIVREGGTRRMDVTAGVIGSDVGGVAQRLESRIADVDLPRGYSVQVLGEHAERQAAQRTLLIIGVGALLVILLLLHLAFGSMRLALLFFPTLLVALVGGVLSALATGGVVSLGSLVGFLTVFGIAARNGIMMISHFQHLERVEGMPFGRELVIRGACERLSPVLMTAGATAFALIPLVWAGSIPGHEIEHPMAIVILGGLITSTLLNLCVVPSLYLRFAPSRAHQSAARPIRAPAGAPGTDR
ncbi:MAG: acriflavin resistance protein [Marmoricola sp.]|nr:acriflavin resistance protein [Marmoricola sp.]